MLVTGYQLCVRGRTKTVLLVVITAAGSHWTVPSPVWPLLSCRRRSPAASCPPHTTHTSYTISPSPHHSHNTSGITGEVQARDNQSITLSNPIFLPSSNLSRGDSFSFQQIIFLKPYLPSLFLLKTRDLLEFRMLAEWIEKLGKWIRVLPHKLSDRRSPLS